jgi:hypothetical protein
MLDMLVKVKFVRFQAMLSNGQDRVEASTSVHFDPFTNSPGLLSQSHNLVQQRVTVYFFPVARSFPEELSR